MLPFLKNKKTPSVMIQEARHANGNAEKMPPTSEQDSQSPHDMALEACSSDLIQAITANDPAAVAQAIRAAFEILESEPHQEAGEPTTEPAEGIE